MSFAAAAQLSAALVVFDGPRSVTAERIERLREFTSKNSWEYRALGTEKLISRGKCCLVVVAGEGKELKGLLSHPGIEDWSIQIRMKARAEQKGGQ
ncbi:hypothetical protein [Prosthecobacter dejongeii]|uniref:Uncharacterized protein n=1 Tax=Prosthecobacter dejongeii TaxID=48465 RepID=A0A7W7YLJ9_9BACT|nr:hypothetical protein [Prosthecobacter dejongeii]MBB5038249.1 hypothetical protein [Prosthecobacter dejongeii]